MSIASRIENMYDNVDKAYESIGNLGVDLTGVDKNLENLSDQIDAIFDELPKVESEDTDEPITLENTKRGRLKLQYKGNTSQFSTTGRNKLQITTFNDNSKTKTSNGITATINDDGSVKVTGTASSAVTMYFTKNDFTLSGNFYYLCNSPSANARIEFACNVDGTAKYLNDYGTGNKQNATESFTFNSLTLLVANGTSVNTTFKPMIALGTTVGDYEPFTGGNPSPNPSYPQDIHIVSGDNEIKVCNKNLFNFNDTYHTRSSSQSLTISGTDLIAQNTSTYANGLVWWNIPLKVGETITISYESLTETTTDTNGCVTYMFTDTPFTTFVDFNDFYKVNKTNKYATTIVSKKYLVIGIRTIPSSTNTVSKLQVEYNSTATDYVEHQEQSQLISLGVKNEFKASKTVQGNYNATTYIENNRVTWFGKQVAMGDKMTITCNNENLRFAAARTTMGEKNSSNTLSQDSGWQTGTYTITFTGNGYAGLTISKANNGNITTSEISDSDYTITYNGNHYSPTPIEMGDIGDYEDEFFKNTIDSEYYDSTLLQDKWYLKKRIGKVVVSDNIVASTQTNVFYYSVDANYLTNLNKPYCNYYKGLNQNVTGASDMASKTNNTIAFLSSSSPNARFYIKDTRYTTASDINNWASTHNIIVYYPLATPTNTEITDTTLISQLETILYSYQGQTNISQVNNDMPFVIKASALKDMNTITLSNSNVQTLSMSSPLLSNFTPNPLTINSEPNLEEPIIEETEELNQEPAAEEILQNEEDSV